MTAQIPATAEIKKSGSGFSKIFDSESRSGSERKTQNPAGVGWGTPDPWPPLLDIRTLRTSALSTWNPLFGHSKKMLQFVRVFGVC